MTQEQAARDSAARAVQRLIEDGVEFQATFRVLNEWLYKHNLVVFDGRHNGMGWQAEQADGIMLEPDRWLTFHEMLAALLERIDNTEPPAPVATDTGDPIPHDQLPEKFTFRGHRDRAFG